MRVKLHYQTEQKTVFDKKGCKQAHVSMKPKTLRRGIQGLVLKATQGQDGYAAAQ